VTVHVDLCGRAREFFGKIEKGLSKIFRMEQSKLILLDVSCYHLLEKKLIAQN